MPTPYRYVTPVPPGEATGLVGDVYAQLATDFGLARMPVFMTLSPAPDVLAAAWAVLRESLVTGGAPRTGKEVVALAVSLANRCPFCVAAHTTLLHATGDHRLAETIAQGGVPADPGHARLLAWARATRIPGGAAAPPAGPAHEYIGTAMAFHFINRIASALLTDDLLPAGLHRSRLVRRAGGMALSRAVRRRAVPGASLPLLAEPHTAPEPGWAAGTPVGTAFAALRTAACAGAPLGEPARTAVTGAVAGWDGSHPPIAPDPAGRPLAGLPAGERAGARIALLTALAAYRVTDADVAAWRETVPGGGTDADLVRLVAFGAIAAVAHAETSLEPSGARA